MGVVDRWIVVAVNASLNDPRVSRPPSEWTFFFSTVPLACAVILQPLCLLILLHARGLIPNNSNNLPLQPLAHRLRGCNSLDADCAGRTFHLNVASFLRLTEAVPKLLHTSYWRHIQHGNSIQFFLSFTLQEFVSLSCFKF